MTTKAFSYDGSAVIAQRSPIHGLGVFALRDFKEGAVMEIAPVIYIPRTVGERNSLFITDYAYGSGAFGEDGLEIMVVLLGNGSLYNHSDTPSAAFDLTYKDCLRVIALRDISAGEELRIHYGPDYWDAREDILKVA